MAATDVIAELAVNLRLDSSAFARGSSTAASQAKKLEGSFSGLPKGLGAVTSALGGLAGSFAGGLLVGGLAEAGEKLVELGKGAIEHAASLHAASQQLGVTTDDLQRYRFAASQVGIEQDKMDLGLKRLSKSIGLAALGGPTIKVFDRLGISIRDANGQLKTAGELVPEIAAAVAQLPDPAARAAVEFQLFGRSGQDMAPLLNKGAEGVNNLTAAADKAGVVISPELIARAHELEVRFSKLKQTVETKVEIGLLTGLETFTGAAEQIGGKIDTVDAKLKTLQQHADDYDRRAGIPARQDFVNSIGLGAQGIKPLDDSLVKLQQDAEAFDRRLGIPSKDQFFASIKESMLGDEQENERWRAQLLDSFNQAAAGAARLWHDFDVSWNNLTASTHRMVVDVESWLKTKLTSATDWAAAQARKVADAYREMADKVVFHSYVPDMVDGIAGEFARLVKIMVDPTVSATDKVQSAFEGLGSALSKLLGAKAGGIFGLVSQFASAFAPLLGRLFGKSAPGLSLGDLEASGLYPGVDFGGFRAAGGPVVPGKAYVVGENGPEYVSFGSRGFVTPANDAGSAGDVIVNQTFTFEGVAVTRDEFIRGLAITKSATISAIRENRRRRMA